MAVISSFYWSGFPFDNICPTEVFNETYVGEFTITNLNDNSDVVTQTLVGPDSLQFQFCNQNLLATGKWAFPFIPEQQAVGEEWMNEEQRGLTQIFGWTSVGIIFLVIVMFVSGWVDMFRGCLLYTSPSPRD